MKIDEIRGKTDSELEFELKNLTKECFDRRFKSATDTSTETARLRNARRAVARIRTVLHERAAHIRGQESR